jgi:thioesterase domain-containing protein
MARFGDINELETRLATLEDRVSALVAQIERTQFHIPYILEALRELREKEPR